MAAIVTKCPSCAGEVKVTREQCQGCGVSIEGSFDIPPLLQLESKDIAFIESFLLNSGSLKAMAELEGISYPTVRNRLDEIIEKVKRAKANVEKKRSEILDALERGTITPKQAVKELRKVGNAV